jgi:hypothetical protein
MYDTNDETGAENGLAREPMAPEASAPNNMILGAAYPRVESTQGDQTGAFADFVRKQPIIMLSVAFGLGLLATSLLARRRS